MQFFFQIGIGLTRRIRPGMTKDIAIKISIFGDVVIVVYISGLILKFHAVADQDKDMVTFNLIDRFDSLVDTITTDPEQIQISHGQRQGYPEGRTLIYTKLYINDDQEYNEGGLWCLDNKRMGDIIEIDGIHIALHIGEDDYCLTSGKIDRSGEYNYQRLESDYRLTSILDPKKYLGLWKNDRCIRTLKVSGFFKDSKMNEYCVVVMFVPGMDNVTSMENLTHMEFYRFKDFVNPDIRSGDLKPTSTRKFQEPPVSLYLTKNQVMWSNVFNYCLEDETDIREDEDKLAVTSLNFWYAPYNASYTRKDTDDTGNLVCFSSP